MPTMYPDVYLPKPMFVREYYILLSLSRGQSHTYAIKASVANDSLGSLIIAPSVLYPLIQKLHDYGMVDLISTSPAGVSGKPRKIYAISEEGLIRLKEECLRLRHAVKIAEHARLFQDETPLDIQRLLLRL